MTRLRKFLLLLILCYCQIAQAQGDDFLNAIGKPVTDPAVKALFEKVNLKYKYGPVGQRPGSTYVSEVPNVNFRFYIACLADESVLSITFYNSSDGEGSPCPYEMPLGITNDMSIEKMKTLFGSVYDSIVYTPNSAYTKTHYTYKKDNVLLTFVYDAKSMLASTEIKHDSPFADSNMEAVIKNISDMLFATYRNDIKWDMIFHRQTHTNAENEVTLERGYQYMLVVVYDSVTVTDIKPVLAKGITYKAEPLVLPFTDRSGVAIRITGEIGEFAKTVTALLQVHFKNRGKAVSVHYALFRIKPEK